MSAAPPDEMLILAGGFGTRLRSVVADVPKPMAPVGGRPFLEHLLDYWAAQGVRRFVLSIGHLAQVVRDHFGAAYRGHEVAYVEEREPLGTGGAIALALREIAWRGPDIVVANGDTWFEASLATLAADAARLGRPITLALKPIARNDRYGDVRVDGDGGVTAFGPPTDGPGRISAGCYAIALAALRPHLERRPPRFSLEADLLTPLARDGLVAASVQDAPFIDIGIPDDYHRFCASRANR